MYEGSGRTKSLTYKTRQLAVVRLAWDVGGLHASLVEAMYCTDAPYRYKVGMSR